MSGRAASWLRLGHQGGRAGDGRWRSRRRRSQRRVGPPPSRSGRPSPETNRETDPAIGRTPRRVGDSVISSGRLHSRWPWPDDYADSRHSLPFGRSRVGRVPGPAKISPPPLLPDPGVTPPLARSNSRIPRPEPPRHRPVRIDPVGRYPRRESPSGAVLRAPARPLFSRQVAARADCRNASPSPRCRGRRPPPPARDSARVATRALTRASTSARGRHLFSPVASTSPLGGPGARPGRPPPGIGELTAAPRRSPWAGRRGLPGGAARRRPRS